MTKQKIFIAQVKNRGKELIISLTKAEFPLGSWVIIKQLNIKKENGITTKTD